MRRIKQILSKIKSFVKITLVFVLISRELFMPKTKKYLFLLSINLLTIDLSQLFNFDSTTEPQVTNVIDSPKEPGPSSSEINEDEDKKQDDNWSRNVMLFILGAGCLLIIGGTIYYYWGPAADVAVAVSTATATGAGATTNPEIPAVITVSAPSAEDSLLVLKVFGNMDPIMLGYLRDCCDHYNTNFIYFTRMLYLLPNLRKPLFRALYTFDEETIDKIIPLVCDIAKSTYK